MKRVYSMILVFIICLCTMFCVPQASAISSYIGWVKDEASLPDWAEADELRKIVFKEYARMSKMKSTLDNGVSYFDYGQTTDDWMMVCRLSYAEPVYYLAQMFVNGNSTEDNDLEEYKNVSIIIVTEESYKKGKAYTIRDQAVREFIDRNGLGHWGLGLPVSNQYWVENKAYQNYESGYLKSDYTSTNQSGTTNYKTYYYNDSAYTPPPESGTEERYAYAHKGDADENGSVTVTDVVALRQYIVNPVAASVTQQVIMDMDGDFDVTVSDVVALRQRIVTG